VLGNVGVVAGFSILLAIQAKIQQLLCSNCENINVSGFLAAILTSWIALGFNELQCFIVKPFARNVLKAFLLTPSGFETAVKRSTMG
jgi:hypothetical protein